MCNTIIYVNFQLNWIRGVYGVDGQADKHHHVLMALSVILLIHYEVQRGILAQKLNSELP